LRGRYGDLSQPNKNRRSRPALPGIDWRYDDE
jgi:hypothetical protein